MVFFRRLGIFVALVAVVFGAVIPAKVHAQSAPPVRPPLSLTTSPLPLNVTTKPGVPVTADIRVKNNGTADELLKIDLMKFGAAGDTGRPQLEDRGPQDQYFNWVSFSETTFTAQPNVWKTIHMTISPPKQAAFGYYYAVVFSRANPDKPATGSSAVEGGVASLVLLTVEAPGARREATIQQLTASQKVYEFLPAKFTIKLHNGGNLHVQPTGTMFITRGSAQVATLDFNSEQGNILPGTDRVFDMSWDDGFPAFKEVKDSNGKTHTKLVWDFSKLQKLRFGRYTAKLVAVYDDGQRDVPVEAMVSFWVIPWRILGVIFLILLLLFAGIWGVGRIILRAIRRNVPKPIVPGKSAVTLPEVPEETIDPNSLAAATTGKKRGRKKKEDKAAEVAPMPEAVPEQPVAPPRRRGRPPKQVVVPDQQIVAPTPKPAAPKPRASVAKKPASKLATKPGTRLARKPAPKKKGS